MYTFAFEPFYKIKEIKSLQFNGFSQHYYESHRNAVEDCGIVNPIDLESIYEKAYNSKYKSTIDFMNDIKWICHNVHILDGKCSFVLNYPLKIYPCNV